MLRLAAAKSASAPSTFAEPSTAHPWSVKAPRPGSGERPLGASQFLLLVCISQDVFGWSGVRILGAAPLVAFHWQGEHLKSASLCHAEETVTAPAEDRSW